MVLRTLGQVVLYGASVVDGGVELDGADVTGMTVCGGFVVEAGGSALTMLDCK